MLKLVRMSSDVLGDITRQPISATTIQHGNIVAWLLKDALERRSSAKTSQVSNDWSVSGYKPTVVDWFRTQQREADDAVRSCETKLNE